MTRWRETRSFFLLVTALAVPLWWLGSVVERPERLRLNLPVSAMVFLCPVTAAAILAYRKDGSLGVRRLLSRAFDFRRIERKIWYVPILLLMPAVTIVAYGLMRLMGRSLPDARFAAWMVPAFFVMFLVGALGEELGWQGYAFDRLQDRWSALTAGIILGTAWAVWHTVPWIQTHHAPNWVAWQFLKTIPLRVLIVWIYVNTGRSVFAAASFHAMDGVSTFLFPAYGSEYDPFLACLLLTLVAAVVAFVWGPRTLARHRFAARHT